MGLVSTCMGEGAGEADVQGTARGWRGRGGAPVATLKRGGCVMRALGHVGVPCGAGARRGQTKTPWLLNAGWTRGGGTEAGSSGRWPGQHTGERRRGRGQRCSRR